MYGGTIYVKKSTNKGSNWSNANGGVPLSNSSAPIIKMAVSQYSTDKLYAATVPGGGARSRLFRSTNGAGNWNEITGTLPDRYYTDIAIDPTNDDRIVVTLSGFGSGHVYYSDNQGNTWTDISANLPDIPHNTAIFDPADPTTIIVGNDLGVYYATGVTNALAQPQWLPFNDGLIDATMVMDLAVASNNKLRMGTHGKGLWETDMPNSLAAPPIITEKINPASERSAVTVDAYPVPTKGGFTLVINNIEKAGKANVKYYDMAGQVVQQSTINLQAGLNVLRADITNQKRGTYQMVIEIGGNRLVKRIVRQ
jgi:hypothetical protein